MKTATDGKKRKKPIEALKEDDGRVGEKKRSKKKVKKQKSSKGNMVDVERDDKVAKTSSLTDSIFGGNNGGASSDEKSEEGMFGTTAPSSLISSIFDTGRKKSTSTETVSATMSLFNNSSIPAATRRKHQPQQQVSLPKAEVDTSREETVETVHRTLRSRKRRSEHRPLLKRALDFPGVFENEENDEGNFFLGDETERAKETADAIRDHGFCVLRNVMDTNGKKNNHKRASGEDPHPLRDIVLPKAKDLQRRLNMALKARGIHHSTETFRFRQAASRCRGRTDVVFDAFDRDPEMAEIKEKVLRNPKIFPVIRNLLGGANSGAGENDVKLVYAGLILSYPGSCDQPWHQDGEPLFPELPGDQSAVLQANLPPYALNVFLPLEDKDGSIEKGPTEFLPGSHKWTDPDAQVESIIETSNSEDEGEEETDASEASDGSYEETMRDDNAIISPVLKQGDALIYDYRVCHRGTANLFGKTEGICNQVKNEEKAKQEQDDIVGSRRILYLMYARPWFTDHVNFDYRKSAESLWDDQKSVSSEN